MMINIFYSLVPRNTVYVRGSIIHVSQHFYCLRKNPAVIVMIKWTCLSAEGFGYRMSIPVVCCTDLWIGECGGQGVSK